MARTKRAKVVSLTQTKAKTREHKENIIESVRDAANQYSYIWVFAVSNMRNAYLSEVRSLWNGSKIFFGKLRVIAKALGETPEEEIRPGVGKIAQRLRGNVGLLMTDSPPAEVLDWCSDYRRLDYARMGNRATETVKLPAGPVHCRTDPPETLPHSIEPQLRALGMPTQLKMGVPTLLEDYTVCKKGEKLTAEKAQILKHLIIQMAHFRLIPLVYWSAVGAPGEDGEGSVVEMPLSDEDRELVETSNVILEPKASRSANSKSRMDEDEDEDDEDGMDEPNEFDAIEARDKAMMLPEGMQL
ncbi:mRNA turnover and ribosome assembly protein [Malassezia caprae]|uniref:Ribosome assembly factor mrt4 n=1 Tax=Malassezia caprae TaxID=1381934 RepID=A0AAF0E886_9BASI|nr:mRNA turnover and ribosome assembly protein [Malassezia caprae]